MSAVVHASGYAPTLLYFPLYGVDASASAALLAGIPDVTTPVTITR